MFSGVEGKIKKSLVAIHNQGLLKSEYISTLSDRHSILLLTRLTIFDKFEATTWSSI